MELLVGAILLAVILRVFFTAGRDRGRLQGYVAATDDFLARAEINVITDDALHDFIERDK